jgi:hypothetical protein
MVTSLPVPPPPPPPPPPRPSPPPPPPRPSPCDRDSEMYAKAYNTLVNQNLSALSRLVQDPPQQVIVDAALEGITPAELIGRYVRCLRYHIPTAPPMDGGRRRSRKYKNRRSSTRSKRCKRSRRRN